jgi:hypothetical protein
MYFTMLPTPQHILNADLGSVLTALFLMKLGGQISFHSTDLEALARDYSGYVTHFDKETELFTLTIKTRPEEFPVPEKT